MNVSEGSGTAQSEPPQDTPHVCLLLATERSGTHFFRSLLQQTRSVAAPGEVANAFSNDTRSSPMSFLRFRHRACLEEPDFFYATPETQRVLLDRYLEHVRNLHQGRTFVFLDVKYSQIGNFNSFWWDIFSRPLLLTYAAENSIKIIHLVRDFVYQTAISEFYAQKSGVWRTKDSADVAVLRMHVEPAALHRKARVLARNIRLFDDWLNSCSSIRISYERLVSTPQETLEEVSRFLGITEPIPITSAFVRTTPAYKDILENFVDLKPFLAATAEQVDGVEASCTMQPP